MRSASRLVALKRTAARRSAARAARTRRRSRWTRPATIVISVPPAVPAGYIVPAALSRRRSTMKDTVPQMKNVANSSPSAALPLASRWPSAQAATPNHHRVMQPGLERIARHVGGGDQQGRDQGEELGCMPHRKGREPELPAVAASDAEAPDDQHEAHDRGDGVEPLPCGRAEPRDLRIAPAAREQMNRMDNRER